MNRTNEISGEHLPTVYYCKFPKYLTPITFADLQQQPFIIENEPSAGISFSNQEIIKEPYIQQQQQQQSTSFREPIGDFEVCVICGDKATGTHYGAISCNLNCLMIVVLQKTP